MTVHEALRELDRRIQRLDQMKRNRVGKHMVRPVHWERDEEELSFLQHLQTMIDFEPSPMDEVKLMSIERGIKR